ncbi:MAG: amidohydrolase family protein [Xanthobacteraceae bacterium]
MSEAIANAGTSARPAPGISIFGVEAIDCDVHIAVPSMNVLLPYLDDYWRESVTSRGLDRHSMNITGQPANAPIFARPDWQPEEGAPGTGLDLLRTHALDAFGTKYAIANCMYGAQVLHHEDMAAAFCRAVNDWIAREWLDREPRLRASITLPIQNAKLCVDEIERRAADRRFVQVLVPVMGEMTLGRRYYWPIYEAAERHGLAVGIHAGSSYRYAPTSIGWPSYLLEDYVAQSAAFENQLLSLTAEGVFAKYPALKVVFMESGFSWLPAFLWRANKTWRGVRAETPWLKRPPGEIIREHVRITLQPVDEPPNREQLDRVIEQIGSDQMLLFSTDFPHWHFDGLKALPDGLSPALAKKILLENPLETYSRLREGNSPKEIRQ